MTRKPIRKFLPLTYQPKIEAVQDGTCAQSIRIDTILSIGDFVAFHGWEGRPYHSSWSFRTPYYEIILAKPINVHADYVYLPEEKKKLLADNPLLDMLAAKDGIDPPTGKELLRVLHAMHGPEILHGKVLRWKQIEPDKSEWVPTVVTVHEALPISLSSIMPFDFEPFEDQELPDDQDPVYCGPDPGDQGPVISEGYPVTVQINRRLFEKIRQAERDLTLGVQ
jgi:hypothetical protein